jgi:type I restriction enzyme S subunit
VSRIDDLIQELCPLGVEYRTVGQVMSTVSTGRGIKRDKYDAGERFPIVDQGQALIAGYTDDESLLVPAGEFVVFGEHTREVKWVNFRFAPGADGTKVLQARDGLLTKFA